MKKRRCGTMNHDYKRNGTATLFAALNALEGQIISMCDGRHRHNDNPKPFIWTAKAAQILEKVKRAHTAFHNRHSA